MKYKVGDRVRTKSLDWYNENKDTSGILSYKISGVPFTSEMAEYCGCIVTIDKVIVYANSILCDRYHIKEDDGTWEWHEKMFEGLAEEDNPFDDNIPLPDSFVERMVHKIADSELFNAEPLDIPTMTTDFVKEHGLPCPDGYEFRDENGNVINATKIVLEKKKPKYPKTIIECCSILKAKCMATREEGYKGELLKQLQLLLICRDAYWKLAGDWKANWNTNIVAKYCIGACMDRIEKHLSGGANYILAFPTEEIRDAFYENFKDLIEECKELL